MVHVRKYNKANELQVCILQDQASLKVSFCCSLNLER
jgi:hypothetical protein